MHIYNGQLIDIYSEQVIDEVRYSPLWLSDPERRAQLGIVPVTLPPKPEVTSSQKVTLGAVFQSNGEWTAEWEIKVKSAEELAAEVAALAKAKLDKNTEIDQAREKANRTTFPFQGRLVACDELSRSDIDGVAGHINLLGSFPPGFPGGWKTTDKVVIPLPSIEEFKAMYSAMTAQGTANFNHSQQLKAQLAAATTLTEVAAIAW